MNTHLILYHPQSLTACTMYKLADYILLNAYSVKSSGLYNGKAGISLALSEFAKNFNNDYYKEQASDLLKDAILYTTDDVSFENGLSGIGYVLIYCALNKLITNDFIELLDQKTDMIINLLFKYDDTSMINYIRSIPFLWILQNTNYKHKKDIRHLINKIFTASEFHILDCLSSKKKSKTILVIPKLETYFSMCKYSNHTPSYRIFEHLIDAYEKDKIVSNIYTAYYIKLFAIRNGQNRIKYTADNIMHRAIANIQYETMSLHQIINTAYILRQQHDNEFKSILKELETTLFHFNNETALEYFLTQHISSNDYFAGYETGVARLILYYMFLHNKNSYGSLPFA